jgi:serpin B
MKIILSLMIFLLASPIASAESELVKGNNAFALNLYNQIKDNKGNIFLSPYSISSAFAMCYAGARGNTQQEMAAVLHFPEKQGQLHNDFANLNLGLKEIQKNGYVELNVANSLWAQEDYDFLPEYLAISQKYYDAKIGNVDFRHDTENTRQRINNWTEEKTNNLIKEIIPRGILHPEVTKLVLVNAVYFKGEWLVKFEKESTRNAPFWVTPEQSKNVSLMCLQEYFEYGEDVDTQVLVLPYKGSDLSMVILLPKNKGDIKNLEDNLTMEHINKWINATQRQETLVYLPKFTIGFSSRLKEYLTALGMNNAFIWPGADFSGMDGTKWLYISEALHKVWVKVDEEGTEAAAATSVIMRFGGAPSDSPKVFRADHPFIFLIKDNHSGNMLFMGRLNDPTDQ